MFLAFAMIQQVTAELSGAAMGKENIAVIAKAVLQLLKNNANNRSETTENHSIQC
jgi:hypothetical protein